MKSPITTFLFVLMRDHLPTGTVKFLIDQAQRAGDPATSAPELEQLAERYAAELLKAPPRLTDADLADEEPESAPPPIPPAAPPETPKPPKAAPPKPPPKPKSNQGKGTGDGKASAKTLGLFRDFIRERGRVKPGELDELGYSSATRARCTRALREEGFLGVEYEKHQRYLVVLDRKTSEPDPDDAEEGSRPADPAGDTGERDHDDEPPGGIPSSPAHEDRGSDDDGRESGSTAGAANGSAEGRGQAAESTPPPADAALGGAAKPNPAAARTDRMAGMNERVAKYIDDADGEVWPRELESHFDLSTFKRLRIVNELKDAGKIIISGGGGPNTRYRSVKHRRPAQPRRPGTSEAAEPLGQGRSHLRDNSAERRKDAKAERDQVEATATKAMPAIREWVHRAGAFTPRQLRDVFDLEPAATTYVLAALTKEGLVERFGEQRAQTYRPIITTPAEDGGPPGKRPLSGGSEAGSLEGRALALLDGEGLPLASVGPRLGVSSEVAQAVVGRLYRQGEVRPRHRNGTLHYAATA